MKLTMTRFACKKAAQNGLTAELIKDSFEHPVYVKPNPDKEGQYQVGGKDITFVGVPKDDSFLCITLYGGK